MGFGKQIADNPLFSAVSEDFIKVLQSPANVYDFGDFKFPFIELRRFWRSEMLDRFDKLISYDIDTVRKGFGKFLDLKP